MTQKLNHQMRHLSDWYTRDCALWSFLFDLSCLPQTSYHFNSTNYYTRCQYFHLKITSQSSNFFFFLLFFFFSFSLFSSYFLTFAPITTTTAANAAVVVVVIAVTTVTSFCSSQLLDLVVYRSARRPKFWLPCKKSTKIHKKNI